VTAAYVGLGANLGDPRRQLEQALRDLDELPGTHVRARSSLYRTAPVGYADQPDFVNAVAALETRLPAMTLLAELQAIEARHARSRSFANAPRTLDLDLLLFGDERIAAPGLTVPHPRMHERAFVLVPLLEIAPEAAIPGHGKASALLERCASQAVQRIDA
jgi:2-amino-4-hydroxy-6-hydroxymethyldihydropteridine diphosphokinase